jgi:hypothetical protein
MSRIFICERNAASSKERCPMLVAGGIRCRHNATVVPKDWEVPAYCVPGKAVCDCCYRVLRARANASNVWEQALAS